MEDFLGNLVGSLHSGGVGNVYKMNGIPQPSIAIEDKLDFRTLSYENIQGEHRKNWIVVKKN